MSLRGSDPRSDTSFKREHRGSDINQIVGLLLHNHTERCNLCGQANVINPSKTQAL